MNRFDIEVEGNHNYFVDGVMVHNSPETTTGGKALKFYASVRMDVRRIETLKDGTEAVGNRTRVKVVKNKVSPPFKQAEFDILYGRGISREGSLIDMGVDQGFIRKSGSWFTYDGEQLGQGKENARNYLLGNADVANEIEKKIKEKLGIGAVINDDDVLPLPSTSKNREELAHALCLRLLTARARTRAELAGQLAKRGYAPEIAERVLARPLRVGLLTTRTSLSSGCVLDSRTAEKASGLWPPSFGRRGVDDDVIATAPGGIDAGVERCRAEQLVEHRLRREVLGDGDNSKVIRRLVGMLARRGYSQGMAFAVVTDALAAERERRRV